MDVLDKKALEVVVNDFKLIFALAFALAFNIITDDDLDREALKEAEERINAACEKYGEDVVNTAVEMNMKDTFYRNLNRRRPDPWTTCCACADYMFGKEKDDEHI